MAFSFGAAWNFPSGMTDTLAGYACRFDVPFWTKFDVHGDTRSITVPDGTLITEKLEGQGEACYGYSATGVPGISAYRGRFDVTDNGTNTTLAWRTSWEAQDADAVAHMININAAGAQGMFAALASHFAPVPTAPPPAD